MTRGENMADLSETQGSPFGTTKTREHGLRVPVAERVSSDEVEQAEQAVAEAHDQAEAAPIPAATAGTPSSEEQRAKRHAESDDADPYGAWEQAEASTEPLHKLSENARLLVRVGVGAAGIGLRLAYRVGRAAWKRWSHHRRRRVERAT